MLTDSERARIAGMLVWDYAVQAEEVIEVLEGRRKRVAVLDRDALFRRMLAGLAWHTIIEMVGIDEIRRMLTPANIAKLWPAGLRERYERIRKLLRGEPVPFAGWGSPEDRERVRRDLRRSTFSQRWYRTEPVLLRSPVLR